MIQITKSRNFIDHNIFSAHKHTSVYSTFSVYYYYANTLSLVCWYLPNTGTNLVLHYVKLELHPEPCVHAIILVWA